MLTLKQLIINSEIMKLIRNTIYTEDVSKYRENIFLMVNKHKKKQKEKKKKKKKKNIKKEKTTNFKIFYLISKMIFRKKITS